MPHQPLAALRHHLEETVLGASPAIFLLQVAVLARGHALVTGAPGIGKTSLAASLASSLGGTFKRIQFTSDLLPSDLLGYNLYRAQDGHFEFVPGPVFANTVLADEINRASPRTQSALLEAMNDGQVTIDGVTRALPQPFLVIGTQNSRSSAGTFPLPDAQLDRFLVSIPMPVPDLETQLAILKAHSEEEKAASSDETILSPDDLAFLQNRTATTIVAPPIQRYLLALCQAVRSQLGSDAVISTRALLALQTAARAAAVIDDCEAVHPDHVQEVLIPVLQHRLFLDEPINPLPILAEALREVRVP